MVQNPKSNYFIVDDFLPPEVYTAVKNKLEHQPWFFHSTVAGEQFRGDGPKTDDSGFTQVWYHVDDQTGCRHPDMLQLIDSNIQRYFHTRQTLRVRTGLLVPVGHKKIHAPHIDIPDPHWTALIYFSSEKGSGQTYLYDELYDPYLYATPEKQWEGRQLPIAEMVEAKENRVVFFRGDMYHSSSAPETILKRIAMNINFTGHPRNANTN